MDKKVLCWKDTGVKILIVDDESSIRKLLDLYLVNAGYSCSVAEDAASAKELLAVDTFDLLISDLRMPGDSGLKLIQYVKEHYPQMGRVMVTGIDSPEVASEIMAIGVYGYIIKPFTKNVVLITVENALRHLRLDLHMHACKLELEKNISLRTEKLTAIMNNIKIGVAMFDLDMKILEFNRRMQQWFPEISLGMTTPCYNSCLYPPAEDNRDYCPMISTLQTGEVCEKNISLSTPQGEREFKIVTSPILDSMGNVYAGISIYEDVTLKMQLERELRQAHKLEAVGQLAAGIAHEINSPIQYIGDNVGFLRASFDDIIGLLMKQQQLCQDAAGRKEISVKLSQKLEDEAEKTDIAYLLEEIPPTFDQTIEGIRHVEKIVRAMKDFSHPGGDEKTAADINKIIESTVTVCRNEWKYVAEMQTELAPDLQLVPCFAGEISQVILNIIVNAAHAIGDVNEGGSKGKGLINIQTGLVDNYIQIKITDTGGGIPEKNQDRIFDPFFTTKILGKGTGQGLAIAYRVVVDKHQGRIFFESEKGRGTTFVIELPLISEK